MTRRPTEPLTPLENTLIDLPQEQAPEDLQDRCLAALDAAQVARPARRAVPWTHFAVAAAASLLIALIALPVLTPGRSRDKARFTMAHDARPTGPAAPAGPGAPGASMPASTPANQFATEEPPQVALNRADSWQDSLDKSGPKRAPVPAAPGAPGGPISQTAMKEGEAFRIGRVNEPNAVRVRGGDRVAQGPSAQPALQPMGARRLDGVVPSPSEPWYDRSPDRRKITSRDMEIETPEVEETYHKVVDVIEKAGGYIATENLIVQEDEPDKATLAARVPTDSFDAVLQQLRGLGKLVKLTGTSEDRTLEYKSRGADIRGLSVAEQKLVARYERETNPHRKAAIKLELDSLRRTLHSEKQALQVLAAETAFGYLNMEITEGSHFWQTVKDKAGDTLPIAMALALVALPFFVVALIWRRRA